MVVLDTLSFGGPKGQEMKIAIAELLASRVDQDWIESTLTDAGLSPARYFLRQAPALVWREIVLDAVKRRKLDAIVEAVAKREPAFSMYLEEVVRRLLDSGAVWYPCRDPYYCGFFGPGAATAMIDRRDFRSGLQDLANEQFRVLVVSGPRGSGKSHSWLLIDHLREAGKLAGHECICVSTHDWSVGTRVSGAMIVEAIADQLCLDVSLTGSDELGEARTRKLLNQLAGAYNKNGTVVRWIVIDGLDRDEAIDAADAKDVTLKLIDMVKRGRLAYTRLVVTGFDRLWLPTTRQILLETIPVIDEVLVCSFLADCATHQGYQPGSDALVALAREVLAAGGPSRDLGLIEEAVLAVVKREWGAGGTDAG
jgi:hypothetical protein